MKKESISTIKQMLLTESLNKQAINELKNDERKGVQKLIKVYENKLAKHVFLENQFNDMSIFEQKNYDLGKIHIAGIDEAGRGPLAGPVVAAAVILPKEFKLLGLTDSKLVSTEKRDLFYEIIKKQAVDYSITVVNNEKIDELNILQATKLAMITCLNQLKPLPDHVLIDAVELEALPCSSESIIKGDLKSISIAAASILAKVTRDRLMKKIHHEFPVYQFDSNMGYGTKHHIDMLEKYGPTSYHRRSFAPVRNNM